MAWSSSAVTAKDLLYQQDKPVLVGSNVLELPVASAVWNWDTGNYLEPDRTDPLYPAAWAYDRYQTKQTRPVSSQLSNVWWFVAKIGLGPFDFAAILGNNFGTAPQGAGGINVSIEIADLPGGPWTRVSTIQAPATSSKRIIWVDLNNGSGPLRYTGASYLRAKILLGASSAGWVPYIGELVVGRKWQVFWRSDVPYDESPLRSEVSDFRAKSTLVTRYVEASGQRVLMPHWSPSDATDISNIRNWWTDCAFGTKAFMFVDYPNSNPVNTAYWMMIEHPELAIPLIDPPAMREWSPGSFLEQPQFVANET